MIIIDNQNGSTVENRIISFTIDANNDQTTQHITEIKKNSLTQTAINRQRNVFHNALNTISIYEKVLCMKINTLFKKKNIRYN